MFFLDCDKDFNELKVTRLSYLNLKESTHQLGFKSYLQLLPSVNLGTPQKLPATEGYHKLKALTETALE